MQTFWPQNIFICDCIFFLFFSVSFRFVSFPLLFCFRSARPYIYGTILYTALRNALCYSNATHVARWHSPGRLGDSTRAGGGGNTMFPSGSGLAISAYLRYAYCRVDKIQDRWPARSASFWAKWWQRSLVNSSGCDTRRSNGDGDSDVSSDASSTQPQPKRQLFSLIFRYLIHDRRRIGRLFSHLLANSLPASNAVYKLVLLMPTPVPVPARDPCCVPATRPASPHASEAPAHKHNPITHVDPDADQLGSGRASCMAA